MRTDESITARERAALRSALALDGDRIDQAVTWARQAGYERAELAGAILDAATRATAGKPGAAPADPLRAAIFLGSPHAREREDRFLAANLARAGVGTAAEGVDWVDLATRARSLSPHELALKCVAEAVRRRVLAVGQGGFTGLGWALPGGDADEERDPEPEIKGEPA